MAKKTWGKTIEAWLNGDTGTLEAEENGATPTGSLQCAALLDIARSMRRLVAILECRHFQKIPQQLSQIRHALAPENDLYKAWGMRRPPEKRKKKQT